jgi:hypothetical protein
MIKEILQQIDSQLLKLGILTFAILGLIFHILPKSEKKEEAVGFIGEILNFVKAFFKK